MRILITGATGFVGRHVIKALSSSSAEISIIVHEGKKVQKIFSPNIKKVVSTKDLFIENVDWWTKQCAGIDIVIHLAWYVEPGLYLESSKNIDCLIGSLKLAKGAVQAGVKRFIGVGTCFEYDLLHQKLSINTPLNPITTYASTKTALYFSLSNWLPKNAVEFAWCRLFYLYGEGEDPRRLVPYLRKKLEEGKIAELTSGKQVRDFLNVAEAAKKIVKVALGNQKGPINICSGIPITVRHLAEQIADEYGRRDLLKFKSRPDNLIDPPYLVGVSNVQ